MTRAARERGFTLVEALIALAIIAGMTATLVDIAQSGARSRNGLRERREALMLAQSALDGSYEANGSDNGAWRGYTWHVERHGEGAPDALDRHPLEHVSVVVASQGRPVIRLGTVRLRP